MSSKLPTSPISKINYDILAEIFMHCLPKYPLGRSAQRPHAKAAPLLLCQVCSSWRSVAFLSARLWSHLYYDFTVFITQGQDAGKMEYSLLAREIEFVQWWRNNQGAIPPFLRLGVKNGYRRTYVGELAPRGMDIVLDYAASAQYLALSSFLWTQLHKRSEAGYPFVPSHLHTLLRHGAGSGYGGIGLGSSSFQAEVLVQPRKLRRLWIDDVRLRMEPTFTIPRFFSTLTHISVYGLETSLAHWFALLDGLPLLEWAHFSMEEPRAHTLCAPRNSITLPRLSTLYVTMREYATYSEHVPFSALFTHVHLPAVRTLSLAWAISQLRDAFSLAGELVTVLASAPAVTTLALAERFLELAHPASAPGHAEPIWTHASNVAELRLEKPGFAQHVDPLLWDMLLTPGRWLDLQQTRCPVRVVTLADPALAFAVRESLEAWTARSLNLIKRRLAEKTPNVIFRFTSQSEKDMVEKEMNKWEEVYVDL